MFRKQFIPAVMTLLAISATLTLSAGMSRAQLQNQQGWQFDRPQASSDFPWNSQGYQGYYEPEYVNQAIDVSAPMVQPVKYESYVLPLPTVKNTVAPNTVTLVAHVPENAQVWIEGQAVSGTGTLRTYQSPPVTPGDRFTYKVRVAWVEAGKLVSEKQEFPVKAGDVHSVFLIKAGTKLEGAKETVESNLAKLSPEDRKLAEAQKYCAVQKGVRLGAMGVPFKTMIDGAPVFLCCESCLSRAQSDPARTLATVTELKEKSSK
jgi:uncharacterized protein (TIGR03000 family)